MGVVKVFAHAQWCPTSSITLATPLQGNVHQGNEVGSVGRKGLNKKLNNGNSEHYARMKYLHLGIFFGLHTIDLVLSFLGFSTAISSTDSFLWVEPSSVHALIANSYDLNIKYLSIKIY